MALAELKDSDLARKCRQGDARAWRELIRRFSPAVYRLALRMLKDAAAAEDASQEVFLRVHRSFGTFDLTRPLRPWVSRIAYNVCLRRIGQAGRAPRPLDDPETVGRVVDERRVGPEGAAASREAVSMLEDAMDELSAQDRGLLVMRYRDGLTDVELAEASGMPVNTVKTRVFRARRKLQGLLRPAMGGA